MGRRFNFLVYAAFTLMAIAGCGSDDGGPLFNAEGGRDIACMTHQPEPPGSRYTDPERRDTGEVLEARVIASVVYSRAATGAFHS
ncbi:MAG: hypothetical protein ACRDST_12830 [Pseudonocardiaceae bacterium]